MEKQESSKKDLQSKGQGNLFKYMHTGMHYVDFNGDNIVKNQFSKNSSHQVKEPSNEAEKEALPQDIKEVRAQYDKFWEGFNIMKNININLIKAKQLENNG